MPTFPVRVPIQDLPAYLAEHGLKVVRVYADDNLRITAVVEKEKDMPKSKLSQMLAGLVRRARAKPGSIEKIELPGGLTVSTKVGSGETRLLLARQKTYPSPTEWTTVLDHWPEPLPELAPEKIEHNSWFGLRAAWPEKMWET